MVRNFEYPKKKANKLNRYDSRGTQAKIRDLRIYELTCIGTYDLGQIHSIVNSTKVLHVSFPPDNESTNPFPALLPMIGVMGSYDYPSSAIDEPLDCYLHGYVSSRLMRLAKDSEKGLPVSIAATSVDGLVLSLTPNSHSYNYRSAVLQGYGRPVETDAEKVYAMELITNKVVPDRWQNSRVPPDKVEMTSTMILRVKIESGSGKIRHGEPHDEAKDLDRKDVTSKTWTGVVPVYESFEAPIPNPSNEVGDVPEYITQYVKTANAGSRKAALEAAKE